MAKITKFDRPTARTFAAAVEKALAALATEHGVSIKLGTVKYRDSSCTVTMEVATIAEDGTVATRDADAFRVMAKFYGLSPDDLGKTFRANGTTFKITGLRPRGRKRPIMATDPHGREFVFPAEDVKRFLGGA